MKPSKMKISKVEGYRVLNFDTCKQGVVSELCSGEVYEVDFRSPEWRAELAAGTVNAECPAAAQFSKSLKSPKGAK